MKDFFISYNRADKEWAEWIAWVLEEAGHTVVIQAWEFRPGGNFALNMQRATQETEKTIAVLSEHYLRSAYTQPEWATAFARDLESQERTMIPFRVKECRPTGILATLVYVDLVDLPPDQAREALLGALADRAKPDYEPAFPGVQAPQRVIPTQVQYPGPPVTPQAPMQVVLLYRRNAQPDEQLLELLEAELTTNGYQVFIDRHLTIGVEWAEEIERQVRTADAVIPLLSTASMHSEMLEHEVQIAHQAAQQRDGKPHLLPVRVNYEGPLPQGLAAILNPNTRSGRGSKITEP